MVVSILGKTHIGEMVERGEITRPMMCFAWLTSAQRAPCKRQKACAAP